MLTTHAVGIDLGTTYSCIAYLNEQGEPVSIPNQEGEISTPSVVMYDNGEEIVGTELGCGCARGTGGRARSALDRRLHAGPDYSIGPGSDMLDAQG